MKKRLLSIFLIVCLCAAFLPTFAAAEAAPGSPENPWILTNASFQGIGADSSPVSLMYGNYYLRPGNYKLGENVTPGKTIHIQAVNVTLDLNGKHLTGHNRDGNIISITYLSTTGGALTLNDSSTAQTGKISNGCVQVDMYGTFTMNGGTIFGAKTGVSLSSSGTFIMTGGSITDCETSIRNWGGTVTLQSGTTLRGNVQNTSNFPYAGNTFKGVVQHGNGDEFPINGGTFLGKVENGYSDITPKSGLITGGVFRNEVLNYAKKFNGESGKYSVIKGGVFYGEVTNMQNDKYAAHIEGGVFYGKVINQSSIEGVISGGVFLGGIDGEKPTATHNITLDLGNGEKRDGFVVGDTLYPLGEPPVTREGYRFVGWFDEDGNPWDFKNDTVTGDIALTAGWESTQPEEKPDGAAGLVAILDDMPFVDVDFNDYFYDSVKWAYHAGVTGGTDAWHFSPDAGCTRAQAVTFLWRAAGSPSASYLGNFTDVDADAYYAPAVAWAVANGVTNGTSATTFSPEAPCSRGDIVTFLFRAFGGVSNGYTPFNDVAANAYYADAVAWAYEHGVTGGTSADQFSPADACSRAEIVTFLYRVLG